MEYLITFNDLASNKNYQKSIGRFVEQTRSAELQTHQRHRGIQKLEKAIIV